MNLNNLKFQQSKSVQKLLKRDGLNPALITDLQGNVGRCLDHPYLAQRLKAYQKALDALGDSPAGKKLARCNNHRRCNSPVCPICQQLAVNVLVQKLQGKFCNCSRHFLYFITIAAEPCLDAGEIAGSIKECKRSVKHALRGTRTDRVQYEGRFEVDLLTPAGLQGCPRRASTLAQLGWNPEDQDGPVWAPHCHMWVSTSDLAGLMKRLHRAFKASHQIKAVGVYPHQSTGLALATTGSYLLKCPLRITESKEVFEEINGILGATGYRSRFTADMTASQIQDYISLMTKLNRRCLGFASREKRREVRSIVTGGDHSDRTVVDRGEIGGHVVSDVVVP